MSYQLIGMILKPSYFTSFGSDVVGLFLKLAKIWTFGNGYAGIIPSPRAPTQLPQHNYI